MNQISCMTARFRNWNRTFLLTSLCIGLGAITVTARAEAKPSAQTEVVAKVLKTYGGEATLRQASAYRSSGTMTANRHGGKPGKFVREVRSPTVLKIANLFPNKSDEIRILSGDEGWRGGTKVQGMPLTAMKLQAARLALPLSLLTDMAAFNDLGMVTREGKSYRVLERTYQPGISLRVEIAPASHRIIRSTGTMTQGAHTIDFITDYSDYRQVPVGKGSMLMPFQEERTIMGVKAASVTLERVEIITPGGEFKL